RWDRRRVLMGTQMLAMVKAGVLAALFLAGLLEVWHLVVLGAFQGFLSPFDQTARQTLMLRMVDDEKQDLASAVGLNSTMQTAARTVWPAHTRIPAGYLRSGRAPGGDLPRRTAGCRRTAEPRSHRDHNLWRWPGRRRSIWRAVDRRAVPHGRWLRHDGDGRGSERFLA